MDQTVKFVVYSAVVLSFFVFSVFIILLFIAPLMITSVNATVVGVGAFLYHVAMLICHQLPHRSLYVFGAHQPLCARDVGLYAGFIAGVFITLVGRAPNPFRSFKSMVLLTVPMVIDGFAQSVFTLWESNNLIRVITGFLFGIGFSAYFTARILKKLPDFRVVLAGNLPALFVSALLFHYVLFSVISVYTGGYMTQRQAIAQVLDTSQRQYAQAFYIAPKVPVTIHIDPFFARYDDPVLTDISNMNLNRSYGLWVVVLSDEIRKEGNAIFTSARGEYFYMDPVHGKIIERKLH